MKTDTVVTRRNSSAWFQDGKRLFAFFVVFLFIIALFPSLFVSASSETVDFSSQPLPFYDSSSIPSNADVAPLLVGSFTGSSGATYAWVRANDVPVYVFGLSSNGVLSYVCCTDDFYSSSDAPVVCLGTLSSNGSYNAVQNNYRPTMSNSDSELYSLYYVSISSSSFDSFTIPVFTSLADGFSAVRDYIDNGGSGGGQALHELAFTLPAGNVAFIDISGDDFNDMLVSTTLSLPGNGSSLNQTWGYVDSIPSSFTLPISGATTKIAWNGVGQATIFGGLRTQFQRYYTVNDSNGKYLVIVNPFYSADYENNLDNLNSGGNKILYNSPVLVHVDQAVSYRIFGLNTQLGYQDNEWSIDTNSNGDSWSGTFDDSTGVWGQVNDQTGLAGNPVNGGSNTVVGVENSVTDWLENIAHTISGFFNGAIGAVTTLVNAGSDFFQSVGSLYSWLPAPVYSVLISAAILAITIGVIKCFL